MLTPSICADACASVLTSIVIQQDQKRNQGKQWAESTFSGLTKIESGLR